MEHRHFTLNLKKQYAMDRYEIEKQYIFSSNGEDATHMQFDYTNMEKLEDVMKAHRRMREIDPSYTGIIDTCTLMRYFGYDINIVPGPRGNIKVTTPEDLYLFRAMIQYKETANVFGFNSQEVTRNLRK